LSISNVKVDIASKYIGRGFPRPYTLTFNNTPTTLIEKDEVSEPHIIATKRKYIDMESIQYRIAKPYHKDINTLP
jgi:hypothetical protein